MSLLKSQKFLLKPFCFVPLPSLLSGEDELSNLLIKKLHLGMMGSITRPPTPPSEEEEGLKEPTIQDIVNMRVSGGLLKL